MDLDTEAMTAGVPDDKVVRTRAAIEAAQAKSWVGVKEVWSLLGLLGF